MMRVLVDHQAFCLERVGGITRYHLELARALAAQQLAHVDFFAGFHRSGLRKAPHGCGWSGLDLPWMPHTGYPLQVLSSLPLSALPAGRWQVHHQSYVHPFRGPSGTARVMTHHDCIYERWPDRFGDAGRVIAGRRASLARADAVICVSTHARDELVQRYQPDLNRLHVIHHGLTRLPPPAVARPHPRPYLMHVGRRSGYKDFATVLAAWSSSPCLAREFDLVAFGGGPLTADEHQMAAMAARAGGLLQVAGDDSALSTWYAHAAVVVVPSRAEGFGFPVLEGMAAGVPVLAANATSLPEVAGAAARLVPPGDPLAWREALGAVLGDSALERSLRSAGPRRAAQFTWEKCARETAEVYARASERVRS